MPPGDSGDLDRGGASCSDNKGPGPEVEEVEETNGRDGKRGRMEMVRRRRRWER